MNFKTTIFLAALTVIGGVLWLVVPWHRRAASGSESLAVLENELKPENLEKLEITADGRTGEWEAAPLPGPAVDSYGAGDCFAAGLAYGLAESRPVQEALALAARCGAACVTGRGPYEGQLRAAS